MRFKSFTRKMAVTSFSMLAMLLFAAFLAGAAMAQSDDGGFNASAEKKLNFGLNVVKFKDVPVDTISDSQNVVITTSQKAITLEDITVKDPFVETFCSCTIMGASVDCDSESLPVVMPPATTCIVGVAFEPTSPGKVDKRFGMRVDFDAHNTPKHVELIGFGIE